MNRLLAALLLTFAISVPATAAIVGGNVTGGSAFASGGTFVLLTVPLPNPIGPPNSVGNDTFQSPNLFGFDEDQNILLLAALSVNVGTSPIPAGTFVSSHYIFFDPSPSQSIIGTVDFDTDVLGIITSTGFLFASDFLANTGVNYLNPAGRGLDAGDSVSFGGPQRILFDVTDSTPGDYVRVLTRSSALAAPEPGSIGLLGSGLATLAFLMRRKKHWLPGIQSSR